MAFLPSSYQCLLILLGDIFLGYFRPGVERGNRFIIIFYASLTASNILKEIIVTYGPRTSDGYVKEGGNLLHEGIRLLVKRMGPNERFIIPVNERCRGHESAELLFDEQDKLHNEMESYTGYMKNWSSARGFYQRAERFNLEIKNLVYIHTRNFLQAQAKADMGAIAHRIYTTQSVQVTEQSNSQDSSSRGTSTHRHLSNTTGIEQIQRGEGAMPLKIG